MTKEEIIILADKVASGTATDNEIAVFNNIFKSLQSAKGEPDIALNGNKQQVEIILRNRIAQQINGHPTVHRIGQWKWIAVAAVIILLASGAWLLLRPDNAKQQQLVAIENNKPPEADIVPGSNKAVLTLANGSSVVLDSAANGTIANQGTTEIIKQEDGQLRYNAASLQNSRLAVSYNTIRTPRGGQYQVTLPDGTGVWLNAVSSLHFPTAFTGNERLVEITGEAYFEVAKDDALPFRVKANNTIVEVFGTHFNVNAYDDENTTNTTLLEGKVKVKTGSESHILLPGSQVQIDKSGLVKQVDAVNVQEVVAWKNGFFQFADSSSLKLVMRQLSRWYDVEVEYSGTPALSMSFSGKMGRDLQLQQVLKILQRSEVHIKIQNRKIIVLP